MIAISIKGLHKSYGETKAVDGIDLEVEEGEIFGILGPNGAGKTTTLEIVETLREPDMGTVAILGKDIRTEARSIKELIGVQLQTTVFFDSLKTWEIIDLFRTFYSNPLDVEELLKISSLEEKAMSLVNSLSGGQHKRLSIALALVNNPEIVFLDEPTTGLDPQARRNIWNIIEQLKVNQKTVVLTTHYIEEAEHLCDRVAIMDKGKIIAIGKPFQLIDEHVSDSVISFISDSEIDIDYLKTIEGISNVDFDGNRYEISTKSPQNSLPEVLSAANKDGKKLENLIVKKATLEDVFLKLTGRRIRE